MSRPLEVSSSQSQVGVGRNDLHSKLLPNYHAGQLYVLPERDPEPADMR